MFIAAELVAIVKTWGEKPKCSSADEWTTDIPLKCSMVIRWSTVE